MHNESQKLRLVQSRRDFLVIAGGFAISSPFLLQENLNAAEKHLITGSSIEDLRRATFSGLVAAQYSPLDLEPLITRALALCHDGLEVKDFLKENYGNIDLKKIKIESIEKLELTQAVRRMRDNFQRKIVSAHQWDVEKVERFVRKKLQSKIEIQGKAVEEFLEGQKARIPTSVQAWLRNPEAKLHEVLDGLNPEIGKALPSFIRGLGEGARIKALGGQFKADDLARQALENVFGMKDVKSGVSVVKRLWSGGDGVLAALEKDWLGLKAGSTNPSVMKAATEQFQQLKSGFDSATTSLFSSSSSTMPCLGAIVAAGAISGVVSGLMNRGKLKKIAAQLAEVNQRLANIENQLGELAKEVQEIKQTLAKVEMNTDLILETVRGIEERVLDLSKSQREEADRQWRLEINKALNREDTGLPWNSEAAVKILEKAVDLAGDENCKARSPYWHKRLNLARREEGVTARLLDGRIAEYVTGILEQLDRAGKGALGLPTVVSGERKSSEMPCANLALWCEGARTALKASTQLNPDQKIGGMPVQTAMQRILTQGELIESWFRRAATAENVKPMADYFVNWWVTGKGSGGLIQALKEARGNLSFVKLTPHPKPKRDKPAATFATIEKLNYRDFWDGSRTTVYYVDTSDSGALSLFKMGKVDPFQDKDLWQFHRTLDGNPTKSASKENDFSGVKYKEMNGVLNAGSFFKPLYSQGRSEHKYIGGASEAMGETITFREEYLDVRKEKNNKFPTSVLRYADNPNLSVGSSVGRAMMTMEKHRCAWNPSGGTLRAAVSVRAKELVTPHLDELTNMFGALGGAITLAAWHRMEDDYLFIPPLIDGENQIPGTVNALLELFFKDYAYANPYVDEEDVVLAFGQNLRRRVDIALAAIKASESAPGIPVLQRTLFDLRQAVRPV
jgi:outer membrane murein-binding lipoprotein Lpp